MKKNRLITLALMLVGVFSLSFTSARATTIFVDLAVNSGSPASPDTNGNYWNSVGQGASSSNLITTANASTNFTLSMSSTGGLASSSNTAVTLSMPLYPYQATQDFLAQDTTGVTTIKLANLNPTMTYTISFLASRASNDGKRHGDYTLTGSTSNSLLNIDAGSSDSIGNQTIYSFTGVTPDGSNAILLSFKPTAGNNYAYLNLLQIDYAPTVPEPTTMALLGSTMLSGLMLVRRRRSGSRNRLVIS